MSNPDDLDQAIHFYQSGNLPEATKICQQILLKNPIDADVLHLLGVIALQTQRVSDAIGLISRAITSNGNRADYYCSLGEAYRRSGNLHRAVELAHKASQLDPQMWEASNNLGLALTELGQMAPAIAAYRRVVELRPSNPASLLNLGMALRKNGQLVEAITVLRRAIELDPAIVDAYTEIGSALNNQGKPAEAIEYCRRAIEHNPNSAEAFNNLGKTFLELRRIDEAMNCFQTAIELRPELAVPHYNLGKALTEQGELQQAIRVFRKAIEIAPQLAVAHRALAEATLLLGDYQEGWPQHEWRDEPRIGFLSTILASNRPRWNGGDIKGKTILVYSEEGHGDSLQFVRYVPVLLERGAHVVLGCFPELVRLFRCSFDTTNIVTAGDPLPHFDCYCPIMSLPLAFGIRLDSIPDKVPYLKVDPALARKWENLLQPRSGNLRIGLSWAGNPRFIDDKQRSLDLNQLAPLANINRATFFSLQKGDSASQLKSPPPGLQLVNLAPELTDFAETAAAMSCLDLTISTDTSVAHLAGALATPAWVMLKFVPSWRWMMHRTDSPWYPTLRLFRQKTPGDWEGVVKSIIEALHGLTKPRLNP
jgi:tetratricopeptide (TPR) repeat protein